MWHKKIAAWGCSSRYRYDTLCPASGDRRGRCPMGEGVQSRLRGAVSVLVCEAVKGVLDREEEWSSDEIEEIAQLMKVHGRACREADYVACLLPDDAWVPEGWVDKMTARILRSASVGLRVTSLQVPE